MDAVWDGNEKGDYMKTNREVLIEAGVPAEELDAIGCEHNLDEEWSGAEPADILSKNSFSFYWHGSTQGTTYWANWKDYLGGFKANHPGPSGCVKDSDTGESNSVNHPSHYNTGNIETIDYLREQLTEEEFKGFCKGNALKYISRAGKKGDESEDIKKAMWYMETMLNG